MKKKIIAVTLLSSMILTLGGATSFAKEESTKPPATAKVHKGQTARDLKKVLKEKVKSVPEMLRDASPSVIDIIRRMIDSKIILPDKKVVRSTIEALEGKDHEEKEKIYNIFQCTAPVSNVKGVNQRLGIIKGKDAMGIDKICKENGILSSIRANRLHKPSGIWSKIGDVITFIGVTAQSMTGLFTLWFFGTHLMNSLMSKVEAHTTPEVCASPCEVISNFNAEMEVIKGQKRAKEELKNVLGGIVDRRSQAEENGEKYKRGDVIYLAGPSGVGKSYSALCLARALTGPDAKPFIVDASDIDTGSERSFKEQLFAMSEHIPGAQGQYGNYGYPQYGMAEDAALIGRIKTKPNIVVIINEYDKMHSRDFDEVLRSVMDEGKISISGEKVDCSGIVFIITSNESRESLTGGQTNTVYKDDGTGSRTLVKHDKAFLNRLNVVEFDNLTEVDYSEISKLSINKLASHYKEKYGVKLILGNTAELVANKVATLNKGAREIDKILDVLRSTVVSTIVNKIGSHGTEKEFAGGTYEIKYEAEKNEFLIRCVAEGKNPVMNEAAKKVQKVGLFGKTRVAVSR